VGFGVATGDGGGGAVTWTDPPGIESANLSRSSEVNVISWVPTVSFDAYVNVTGFFQDVSDVVMRWLLPSMTTLTWSGADPWWFWYLTVKTNVVAVVPDDGEALGSDRRVGPDDAIAGKTRKATMNAAAMAPNEVRMIPRVPRRTAMSTNDASSPRAQ
jgi:hypothetical protein